MSEREFSICNANHQEGCILNEGFDLCEGSTCRNGRWENPDILPNGIRVDPCDAKAIPQNDYTEDSID